MSSLNKELQIDQTSVHMELPDEGLKALKTLKGNLTPPRVPALLGLQSTYMGDTNNSDQQVGYILLQRQTGGNDK